MLQQLLVNGIIAGGIYALVALGFSVIYRTVKFFHFAHGIVYTAGAYAAYSHFCFMTSSSHPIPGAMNQTSAVFQLQ
jgi:branched-chain amino acid transport system permease protein